MTKLDVGFEGTDGVELMIYYYNLNIFSDLVVFALERDFISSLLLRTPISPSLMATTLTE